MATIYKTPTEIKVPEINFENITSNKYEEECNAYIQALKDFVTKRKSGKNVGEIIQFPVADGYAQYMVASMRPLELIHIPLWDGYVFQYAKNLTPKDVQEQIDNAKALAKLFSNKS